MNAPLLSTPVRMAGERWVRGRLHLYEDRLELHALTYAMRPVRRVLPLTKVESVLWIDVDEVYNLRLLLGGEGLLLRVPNPAEWKFAIEDAFPNVGRPCPGLPVAKHARQSTLKHAGSNPTLRAPEPRGDTAKFPKTLPPAPSRAVALPKPAGTHRLLVGATVEEIFRRPSGIVVLRVVLASGETGLVEINGRAVLHIGLGEAEPAREALSTPEHGDGRRGAPPAAC